MRSFKSKCACSAGAIGTCLCIIFMSIGIVGVASVGLSQHSNMNSMSDMTNKRVPTNGVPSILNIIITFFSGIWGEVILLISFASMNVGIWFSRNRKIVPFSIVANIILYISMYVYYSVTLEILGLLILFFAYFTAFSYKIAKTVKLV